MQQPFTLDSSVHVEAYEAMQAGQGPSQLLVSEMMILAGQAIATIGDYWLPTFEVVEHKLSQ